MTRKYSTLQYAFKQLWIVESVRRSLIENHVQYLQYIFIKCRVMTIDFLLYKIPL